MHLDEIPENVMESALQNDDDEAATHASWVTLQNENVLPSTVDDGAWREGHHTDALITREEREAQRALFEIAMRRERRWNMGGPRRGPWWDEQPDYLVGTAKPELEGREFYDYQTALSRAGARRFSDLTKVSGHFLDGFGIPTPTNRPLDSSDELFTQGSGFEQDLPRLQEPMVRKLRRPDSPEFMEYGRERARSDRVPWDYDPHREHALNVAIRTYQRSGRGDMFDYVLAEARNFRPPDTGA